MILCQFLVDFPGCLFCNEIAKDSRRRNLFRVPNRRCEKSMLGACFFCDSCVFFYLFLRAAGARKNCVFRPFLSLPGGPRYRFWTQLAEIYRLVHFRTSVDRLVRKITYSEPISAGVAIYSCRMAFASTDRFDTSKFWNQSIFQIGGQIEGNSSGPK